MICVRKEIYQEVAITAPLPLHPLQDGVSSGLDDYGHQIF